MKVLRSHSNQKLISLAGVLLVALFLRCLRMLYYYDGKYGYDEYTSMQISYEIYKNFPFLPKNYFFYPFAHGQPPVFFYMLAISFILFGYSLIVARLLNILLEILTIVYVFLLGRSLKDWKVGILAAILLALMPADIANSSYASAGYVSMWFFATAGLYHAFRGLKEHQRLHLILSGFLFSLLILSKELGLIIIPIVAVWLIKSFTPVSQFSVSRRGFWSWMRGHHDILFMILLPVLAWLVWQVWSVFMYKGTLEAITGRGYSESPYYRLITVRGISLLYLSTFMLFTGPFLSSLFSIGIVSNLFRRYRDIFKKSQIQPFRKIWNSTVLIVIASVACLIVGVFLQYFHIFLHYHQYLFRPTFWVGALIAISLLLEILFFNDEKELPSIWIFVTLFFCSLIYLKIVRYLFIILPALALSCALWITPLFESKNPFKKTLTFVLLLLTLIQFLYFDLFVDSTFQLGYYETSLWWPLEPGTQEPHLF